MANGSNYVQLLKKYIYIQMGYVNGKTVRVTVCDENHNIWDYQIFLRKLL